MSLLEIQQQLKDYFSLEKGAFIAEHLELILLIKDFFVTKRSLKHVVEQRKKDNYDTEKMNNLFSDIHSIIESGNYILIPNRENSQLLIENNIVKPTLAVAIIETENRNKIIATAFYRSFKKLKRYFPNKYLNSI